MSTLPDQVAWSIVTAPDAQIFLCEFVGALPMANASRDEAIPPTLLARTYAANSNHQIYLPAPMAYGANFYTGTQCLSLFPFAMPLPSLVIPSELLVIRPIPAPACVRWPPFAWPMLAPLLASLSARSLTHCVAEASNMPNRST